MTGAKFKSWLMATTIMQGGIGTMIAHHANEAALKAEMDYLGIDQSLVDDVVAMRQSKGLN